LTLDEPKDCCQMVRLSTILAWFRQLAAKKYDSSTRRNEPGRPHTSRCLTATTPISCFEHLAK